MYEIEEKRAVLVALGMKKGFQDPEVLSISEHLDKLLNFYYSIVK
ncbi:MAG: aspartyl-phosphate phosphatase Spo0E family protein [Bacillota bacterium]|nr:aspartyl-phosphate phosphatase Spo0E family protein [Bacillota bacterium]